MPALELASTPLFSHANLVSYWKGENLNDSKGSNNLTDHGTTPFNAALFNNGFDGGTTNTTKYVTKNTNLGFTGGDAALSFWVKMKAEPGTGVLQRLVVLQDSGSNIIFDIYYQESGGDKYIVFRRVRSGTQVDQYFQITTLGTSSFHHFVNSYKSADSLGSCYLDGALIGTYSSSGAGASGVSASGFGILDTPDGAANKTTGIIDDVAYFSSYLTAAEVYGLYTGSFGVFTRNITKYQAVQRAANY